MQPVCTAPPCHAGRGLAGHPRCVNVGNYYCKTRLYIYIYAFSRCFYPKRLTIAFRLYIFISTCVPWESNPQPFTQLTQCSTTEPHRNTGVIHSNSLEDHCVTVTRACVSALAHWRDPFWLKQGLIQDTAHRRKVVTTGVGERCARANRPSAYGLKSSRACTSTAKKC